MNFYIDKPTLRDIPAMRNLVLPEVQRGIILDRTEDEMAGAIRSYSVIRVVDSAESQNLGGKNCHSERSEESQEKLQKRDSSVASLPQNDNFKKNAESSVDSAESQNLKKQPANSSIVDEKSGLRSHERGNRTNGSLTKRVASLPDLSPQDEFGSPSKNPIVAFAALQILSLTLAEVRSLIVAENYRRNGLATMLIEHLIVEARALNLKEVLALTYQREVFEKLGFKEIAKESLPNQKIWADCIKCKKFPVCDEIALTKIL